MITVKRAVLKLNATLPIWGGAVVVATCLLIIAWGYGLLTVPLECLAVAVVSQGALSAMGDISWNNRRCWNGAVTTRAFAIFVAVLTAFKAIPCGDAVLTLVLVSAVITSVIFWILGRVQRRNRAKDIK